MSIDFPFVNCPSMYALKSLILGYQYEHIITSTINNLSFLSKFVDQIIRYPLLSVH